MTPLLSSQYLNVDARIGIAVLILASLGGCSSRSVVEIGADELVRIAGAPSVDVQVTDERNLPPSLDLSPEDASRLAAEFRGSIELLPDGKTAASVVKQLVLRAFNKSNLQPQSDEASGPLPVKVAVEQFLGQGYEGPVGFRVGFGVQARITTSIKGFEHGKSITGGSNRWTYYPPIARMFGGPRTSAWKTVIDAGCDEFVDKLASELTPAGSR